MLVRCIGGLPLGAAVRCSCGSLPWFVLGVEKSTTYPTRLETRTKKSSKCASHWVENSYGVMKVKVGVGRLICDP